MLSAFSNFVSVHGSKISRSMRSGSCSTSNTLRFTALTMIVYLPTSLKSFVLTMKVFFSESNFTKSAELVSVAPSN